MTLICNRLEGLFRLYPPSELCVRTCVCLCVRIAAFSAKQLNGGLGPRFQQQHRTRIEFDVINFASIFSASLAARIAIGHGLQPALTPEPPGCKSRPPSSSISYTGQLNDDVRSPGSGSTPGPLSAQPPTGMDPADAAIKPR
uniref:Uncharacterized protein n=1 Tax=Anopheles culicifacies TaxID=139723 RepID=A0A182M5B3_9DIPT